MRLFIAILLSEDMKDALCGVIDDLRAQQVYANYVPMDNLHLTLAFLGNVPPGTIPQIEEAMSEAFIPEMTLSLDAIGNFGNLLWVGLQDNPTLTQYVRTLRASLAEHDIVFDKKKFRPHITIARKVQGNHNFSVQPPAASMTVSGISLMRSDRTAGGMRYTELYQIG